MFNDNRKRLSGSNKKLQKILEDLGPELAQYFEDVKKPRMIKKSDLNSEPLFSLGDEVDVDGIYGVITYGPYKSHNNKETYEVEIDGGDIITVTYNGKNIKKYIYAIETEETDDDFF